MKPGAGGVPSDTPRTDEALKWCRDSGYCVPGEIGDLSRTLETEAAQLRAERDALAVALRKIVAIILVTDAPAELSQLNGILHTANSAIAAHGGKP